MWLLVAVLLASGCQVAAEVMVQVEGDGSGYVEVAVILDEDALAAVPDLLGNGAGSEENLRDLVRTADLEEAGWELDGPERDGEHVRLLVRKAFGTPDEATEVLAELGSGDVFSNLEVSRSLSFGTDRFGFSGDVDLSAGLEVLADDALADALGGERLGESPEAMGERFDRPVGEMFTLAVRTSLPGGVDESWSSQPGDAPVAMDASSTVYDVPVLLLAAVALSCGVGLLVLFVMRTLRSARG